MATKAKPRRFAEDTKVPVEKSRAEIESYLVKHGAEGFSYKWIRGPGGQGRAGIIEFRIFDRDVRMLIPPAKTEQKERQHWRALLLILKSKIETVQTGISNFEEEFLAYFVLGDGGTVGEHVLPRLKQLTAPQGGEN